MATVPFKVLLSASNLKGLEFYIKRERLIPHRESSGVPEVETVRQQNLQRRKWQKRTDKEYLNRHFWKEEKTGPHCKQNFYVIFLIRFQTLPSTPQKKPPSFIEIYFEIIIIYYQHLE